MNPPDSTPTPLTVPEILQRLEHFPTGGLPADALVAAVARREEITPELLRVVREAVERPEALMATEGDGYWLHMFAIFLLAEFKEAAAYPLFVRLVRLPGEQLNFLLGDSITEDVPRLLAAVQGGDIRPIQGLVEDRSVYDYARWSVLRSLCVLVGTGERSRVEVVSYLQELVRGKLERAPSSAWDGVMDCAMNLHPGELLPELKQACENGWADECCLGWDEVEAGAARSPADVLAELPDKERPFTTALNEMSTWHCFRPDYAPESDLDLDLPEPDLPGYDYDLPPAPYVAPAKIGRNDPCPCGSGKKYKKCCLDKA